MSTPSWRLPAARLEGGKSHSALTALCLLFSGCLVVYATAGGGSLLAVGLLPLLSWGWLRVFARVPTSFRFDGRHWYRCDGKPALLVAAYCSTLWLAAILRVDDRCCRCLLWRGQCDRETWRRLRLALRYGTGDSTVSPAAGSSSG